jgi:cytochrome oxidase Cu insertion factor (SCO1/SenC/PrrC family)
MLIRVLLVLLITGVVYSEPLAQAPKTSTAKPTGSYTCPMHPDISRPKPGKCPKCQMALRFSRAKAVQPKPTETSPDTTDANAISSLRIPDVTVQDQHGKSLNFYRDLVKGRVVAVNFLFTSCTAICPSLAATFRKVQQQLQESSLDAQLISISVDPTVDTPERLHAFAQKFKAEAGWTFVTGNSSDIDSLLKEFGVAVANRNDHSPMILIGNEPAGFWTRTYGLSSPTAIVKLISEAAVRK